MNPPKEFADAFIKGYGTRNGQYMRNFFYCQPALNYGFAKPDSAFPWQLPINNPDVMAMRQEMKNVVKFWMDMGSDGFRADMAGALVKTSNISGNEQFFNTHENGTKSFWREIRAMIKKDYPNAFMISTGMLASGPILKLLRDRSVCGPQYFDSGIFTSPIESCSILYFIDILCYNSFLSVNNQVVSIV